MANIITLAKDVSLFDASLGTISFTAGQQISPGHAWYNILIRLGLTNDSGQAATYPPAPYVNQLDDIPAFDANLGGTRFGNMELAYAEANTSVEQPLTTSAVALTDICLAVPPCNRPVVVEWAVAFHATTAGAGLSYALFEETTTGSPVQLGASAFAWLATMNGTWTAYAGGSRGFRRVGPSANWRVFHVYVQTFLDAASPLVAAARNGLNGSETWMRAYA